MVSTKTRSVPDWKVSSGECFASSGYIRQTIQSRLGIKHRRLSQVCPILPSLLLMLIKDLIVVNSPSLDRADSGKGSTYRERKAASCPSPRREQICPAEAVVFGLDFRGVHVGGCRKGFAVAAFRPYADRGRIDDV